MSKIHQTAVTDRTTDRSTWWGIGGSLLAGLFVAYLDRSNLSVGLPAISRDLGFSGPQFGIISSWALTLFLIGYAVANVIGGILTRRLDPKQVVIWCVAIWSVATVAIGLTSAAAVLLVCRFVLGVIEGIYWPQQSRFARSWFAPKDRTTANSLIQYYGQYLALAIGFMVLTPIYDAFGWRVLFFITGGLGLFVIVPLYAAMLGQDRDAPFQEIAAARGPQERLTFASFGGMPFLLLLFSYITQGMLFWGITLWIPLAVRSLGFTGWSQAFASSIPYFAAVLLAYPIARISDRTNQRVLVAALGLLLPGIMIVMLPLADSGLAKMALITIALGYYAGSYTPNIWSILQSSVRPNAVGSAAGIINGVGAGGGGTVAGFLVGLLFSATGSYIPGFMTLGGLVILGGISLLIYRGLKAGRMATDA